MSSPQSVSSGRPSQVSITLRSSSDSPEPEKVPQAVPAEVLADVHAVKQSRKLEKQKRAEKQEKPPSEKTEKSVGARMKSRIRSLLLAPKNQKLKERAKAWIADWQALEGGGATDGDDLEQKRRDLIEAADGNVLAEAFRRMLRTEDAHTIKSAGIYHLADAVLEAAVVAGEDAVSDFAAQAKSATTWQFALSPDFLETLAARHPREASLCLDQLFSLVDVEHAPGHKITCTWESMRHLDPAALYKHLDRLELCNSAEPMADAEIAFDEFCKKLLSQAAETGDEKELATCVARLTRLRPTKFLADQAFPLCEHLNAGILILLMDDSKDRDQLIHYLATVRLPQAADNPYHHKALIEMAYRIRNFTASGGTDPSHEPLWNALLKIAVDCPNIALKAEFVFNLGSSQKPWPGCIVKSDNWQVLKDQFKELVPLMPNKDRREIIQKLEVRDRELASLVGALSGDRKAVGHIAKQILL